MTRSSTRGIFSLTSSRGDEKRLHAVGSGPAVAPLQILQTLAGSGHFDAADRTVERRSVLGILQRSEEFRRVAGKLRHHFGRIGEKHAAGRVGSGTVVLEQGSLVDHEDIAPPQPGQMVGSAATDNAGADDDETSLGTHAVDPPIRTRRPVRIRHAATSSRPSRAMPMLKNTREPAVTSRARRNGMRNEAVASRSTPPT